DRITGSMQQAMTETARRRALQKAYNEKHGIAPRSVQRTVTKSISPLQQAIADASAPKKKREKTKQLSIEALVQQINRIESEMRDAAQNLDFDTAIKLRDEWMQLTAVHAKMLAEKK